MFYIVGNKRCMNVRTARIEAYRIVKKTKKGIDIYKATAQGTADAGNVIMRGDKVYYTPYQGRTYVLYADGSVQY